MDQDTKSAMASLKSLAIEQSARGLRVSMIKGKLDSEFCLEFRGEYFSTISHWIKTGVMQWFYPLDPNIFEDGFDNPFEEKMEIVDSSVVVRECSEIDELSSFEHQFWMIAQNYTPQLEIDSFERYIVNRTYHEYSTYRTIKERVESEWSKKTVAVSKKTSSAFWTYVSQNRNMRRDVHFIPHGDYLRIIFVYPDEACEFKFSVEKAWIA